MEQVPFQVESVPGPAPELKPEVPAAPLPLLVQIGEEPIPLDRPATESEIREALDEAEKHFRRPLAREFRDAAARNGVHTVHCAIRVARERDAWSWHYVLEVLERWRAYPSSRMETNAYDDLESRVRAELASIAAAKDAQKKAVEQAQNEKQRIIDEAAEEKGKADWIAATGGGSMLDWKAMLTQLRKKNEEQHAQ